VKSGYISEFFVSFQGEGAEVGRRQLFIRLAGCNLRCRYCDTPDSLERTKYCAFHRADRRAPEIHPNPLTSERAVELARQLLVAEGPVDGVAVTGGEPLLQADFVAELLRSPELPHPRLLETNGVLPGQLAHVLPQIDIVSMDIKLPSNSGEGAFWEEHEAFLALCSTKAYVKILVDRVTREEEIRRAAALVARRAKSAKVFLQPICDAGGVIDIRPSDLARFYDVARLLVDSVRILPQTHKMVGIR
jgi:7-carboxy-7-deazaguanine synthase